MDKSEIFSRRDFLKATATAGIAGSLAGMGNLYAAGAGAVLLMPAIVTEKVGSI